MHRRSFLACLLIAGSSPLMASEEGRWYSDDGYAIGGYDPVAYHTESRPVKGDTALSLRWQGAEWLFSSAENRAIFEADPMRYAPQYGGYCAFAVSQGYTAKTDPDAFSVVDGRLFLNYSRRVRKMWERDVPGHIASADKNWPSLAPD